MQGQAGWPAGPAVSCLSGGAGATLIVRHDPMARHNGFISHTSIIGTGWGSSIGKSKAHTPSFPGAGESSSGIVSMATGVVSLCFRWLLLLLLQQPEFRLDA